MSSPSQPTTVAAPPRTDPLSTIALVLAILAVILWTLRGIAFLAIPSETWESVDFATAWYIAAAALALTSILGLIPGILAMRRHPQRIIPGIAVGISATLLVDVFVAWVVGLVS